MNAEELKALPTGAVVETGSGIRYTKLEDGYFTAPYAKHTPVRWLLDPEHSKQPVRRIRACAECGATEGVGLTRCRDCAVQS